MAKIPGKPVSETQTLSTTETAALADVVKDAVEPVAVVAAPADAAAVEAAAVEAAAKEAAAQEAAAAEEAAKEAAAKAAAAAAAAAPIKKSVVQKVVFTTDEAEAQDYFKQGFLVRRMTQDGVLGYKIHMTSKVNAVSAQIASSTDEMFKR